MRKINFAPISAEVFRNNLRQQIFWITKCIAQGPYPDEKKTPLLLNSGITHILNVSTSPSNIKQECKFIEVAQHYMEDGKRLQDEVVLTTLNTLNRMLNVPKSKVYIHCSAGWNRSPTILWLYFIACGLTPDDARSLINRATVDAMPGHPLLVDEKLVKLVKRYGSKKFLPLLRLEIIAPV